MPTGKADADDEPQDGLPDPEDAAPAEGHIMTPTAGRRPVDPAPATAKTPGGVYLPKLPAGWRWSIRAYGPDDAGILVDQGNRVALQSDAYNPPAVPTASLADAAREVQKIARAHDALLGIFPKADAEKTPDGAA